MRKRRNPSQPAQETASQGIAVSAIESVTNDCRDTIQSIISNRHLGFTRQDLAQHRIKCTLTGAGASNAFTREQYSVHELLQKGSISYWLAVALYFQFKAGKYYLESISLVVFKGIRTDDVKTALLRAEWDCLDQLGLTKHAQPHWHVYSALINKMGETEASAFGKTIEVKPFKPTENEAIEANQVQQWGAERFHFAMASKWHLLEDYLLQEKLSDIETLIKWITGCVNYIREQLDYLSSS